MIGIMNCTPLLILFDASNYYSSRSNFFFFFAWESYILRLYHISNK